MPHLDLTALQHVCAILVAVSFWGTFRFMRATRTAFSGPPWSPLMLALMGLLFLLVVYAHPAYAVFSASLVVPLFAENHAKAAMVRSLGAEIFRERALEFPHKAGPKAYCAAVASSRAIWIGLSVTLMLVSRQSDLLYWVAAGFLSANIATVVGAVSLSLKYRRDVTLPSSGA